MAEPAPQVIPPGVIPPPVSSPASSPAPQVIPPGVIPLTASSPAPQVIPPGVISPPLSSPAPTPVASETSTSTISNGEKANTRKEAEDAKEKEIKEKAAKDAAVPIALPPELVAGFTRTFTTHAGETITVAELPNAAKHEGVPATVPEADHTIIKVEDHGEKVPPVKRTTKSAVLPSRSIAPVAKKEDAINIDPEANHPVVKDQPDPRAARTVDWEKMAEVRAAKKKRSLTIAPQTQPVDRNPTASSVPVSEAAMETATLHSIRETDTPEKTDQLAEMEFAIGIFPQYFASRETTLDEQVVFRTDGITTHAFADQRGRPVFTLDRKPSLLEDRELRDKSHMFLLGIHKRRFRRPRQW